MVMSMNDRYTYKVMWSAEDEEYVGLCEEFPSLSWLDDTPEASFFGIRRLVAECVEDIVGAGSDSDVQYGVLG